MFSEFDNTPITSLPTEGLNNHLITLSAQNVPNMLRFPKLQNLRKAELTYPYHCCALMKGYGFGVLFENDKAEKRIPVNCDTGEELSPIEDGKWMNESASNDTEIFDDWEDHLISETFVSQSSNGKLRILFSCNLFFVFFRGLVKSCYGLLLLSITHETPDLFANN